MAEGTQLVTLLTIPQIEHSQHVVGAPGTTILVNTRNAKSQDCELATEESSKEDLTDLKHSFRIRLGNLQLISQPLATLVEIPHQQQACFDPIQREHLSRAMESASTAKRVSHSKLLIPICRMHQHRSIGSRLTLSKTKVTFTHPQYSQLP